MRLFGSEWQFIKSFISKKSAFLQKSRFSLVFQDSQRLSVYFYGSINDIFGRTMNRRHEKCPTLTNLDFFLFSERNSFNLNQCALGHRICLLSHEVKYYLEWLHLSHNHLKALQYCKDLEYCLMRLGEDLSFGSDSYFPIGSVNSARDWPARHAWLVITERFELFLIPHIPEMYICWCVSYCLSRKYKNHMQVTKYSSQQALYKA